MIRVFLSHEAEALKIFYGERAVSTLRQFADVTLNETGQVLSTTMLLEQSRGCDVIVLDRNTPGDADFFAGLDGVVSVHRGAVDYSTVDVAAASKAGVLVTNASPGFVDAVIELSIGLMIDLARGISAYNAEYHKGDEPQAHMGIQLKGSTIGIIGYGSIGIRLAEVARAMGMTVIVYDPHKTITDTRVVQVGFEELLQTSDFVHCLAVATRETENLMDEKAFASMKAGAFFINVSRGNLVDEVALQTALTSGHLGGAAMDVGRAKDQKPSLGLAGLPNVIATPHIGGQTLAAIEFQAMETVGQIRALSEGTMPHNALNPDAATLVAKFLQ